MLDVVTLTQKVTEVEKGLKRTRPILSIGVKSGSSRMFPLRWQLKVVMNPVRWFKSYVKNIFIKCRQLILKSPFKIAHL